MRTAPARDRRESWAASSAASAGSESEPPSSSATFQSEWAETNCLTAKAPLEEGTTVQSRSSREHIPARPSARFSGVMTTATLTARGAWSSG